MNRRQKEKQIKKYLEEYEDFRSDWITSLLSQLSTKKLDELFNSREKRLKNERNKN